MPKQYGESTMQQTSRHVLRPVRAPKQVFQRLNLPEPSHGAAKAAGEDEGFGIKPSPIPYRFWGLGLGKRS